MIFDINGPLFCFEFADDFLDPAVRLSVADANGDIIMDSFRLSSPLQYRLGTSEIAMSTPASAACFFDGGDGFGLEGEPPSSATWMTATRSLAANSRAAAIC